MTMRADDSQANIKPENWLMADEGSKVYGSDGEQFGQVREVTPRYLNVKVRKNLLEDVEVYIPRDLVDRADDSGVHLRRSTDELKEMDLSTPPALQ